MVLDNDTIIEQAEAKAATEDYAPGGRYEGQDPLEGYGAINFSPATYHLAKRAKYQAELDELRAQAEPMEAEYQAAPWSRFFLVNNSGGHIHSSMHCSTCRITTSFSWLPTLSGLTEKDAVDAHGPLLCSVCFPSAPVEWIGKGKGA